MSNFFSPAHVGRCQLTRSSRRSNSSTSWFGRCRCRAASAFMWDARCSRLSRPRTFCERAGFMSPGRSVSCDLRLILLLCMCLDSFSLTDPLLSPPAKRNTCGRACDDALSRSPQPSPPANMSSMHSSALSSPGCADQYAASVRLYMSCSSPASRDLLVNECVAVHVSKESAPTSSSSACLLGPRARPGRRP